MPEPLRFERRMSDTEALMWHLEREPLLRSSFLNVTVLDRPPDFDAFRRRIRRAVADIPRLRQRVVTPWTAVVPPEWVDDDEFDLDYHVRRLALAPPGDERQLLDLAALAHQDPFDRSRPLWQFTVVEGLAGGRAALLVRMHHTITDGVGVLRLSASFVDFARDAPQPDAEETDAHAGRGAADGDGDGDSGGRGRLAGLAAAAAVARQALGRPLHVGQRAAGTLAAGLVHPRALRHQAADAAEAVRSLAGQVTSDAARSPLWAGRRSLRRRFEVLSVELARLKAVANSLGGTLNDAFVTALAAGAGAYHREKGAPVGELRTAVAISTKLDQGAAANAVVPTRLLVPAGALDPAERFALVRRRLDTTKRERAIGLTDTMAALFGTLPVPVVANLALQQVATVDFATSNLRGAPVDVFIAGAHVLANHPFGPTGGTAFTATVLSYRDSLDIGLNIDLAAVDDPALLRDCVAAAFEEVLELGG